MSAAAASGPESSGGFAYAGMQSDEEQPSRGLKVPAVDDASAGLWTRFRNGLSWKWGALGTVGTAVAGAGVYYSLPGGTAMPAGYCEAQEASLALAPEQSDRDAVGVWARGLVAGMDGEEKHRLLNGAGWWAWQEQEGYYVGNIFGIPRLGLPSINMHDAMNGFRTTDARMVGEVTEWPCALAVAATWSTDLTWQWSRAIGREFLAKGANVLLGPSVNVHRVARNGRNAEYLSGEDPMLGSALAAAYVRGAQEGAGVAAVVKHFALNHQETDRQKVDAHADEQTRFELYYPPFQAAIEAGVAAVMCAYNFANGRQACSNKEMLTDDLRDRMGFDGFVMSDWWALQDDDAPDAGTDQDQPGTDGYFTRGRLSGLPDGKVDQMASRVLAGMSRASAYLDPTVEKCRVGCNCSEMMYDVNATSAEHVSLARTLATAAAVLLKNEPGPGDAGGAAVLPIREGSTVALVGSACAQHMDPTRLTDDWIAADDYAVGGSGRVLSPFVVSVADGLREKNVTLQLSAGDSLYSAAEAMRGADLVVVCGAATAAESMDRPHLSLFQEVFIHQVLDVAGTRDLPSVVVALAPGSIVAPWRHDASAALLMFLSGQETGHAAADILLGHAVPSGRLPVTLPDAESDAIAPCLGPAACIYEERLHGGWHVYEGRPVAYPFGHGLSYTSFEYKAVSLTPSTRPDALLELQLAVQNVGGVAGIDVPQLYMQFPDGTDGGPRPMQMRGFHRTAPIGTNLTELVTFTLGPRDFSTWDVELHQWVLVNGTFRVFVGASSRDLRLCGEVMQSAQPGAFGPCSEEQHPLDAKA